MSASRTEWGRKLSATFSARCVCACACVSVQPPAAAAIWGRIQLAPCPSDWSPLLNTYWWTWRQTQKLQKSLLLCSSSLVIIRSNQTPSFISFPRQGRVATTIAAISTHGAKQWCAGLTSITSCHHLRDTHAFLLTLQEHRCVKGVWTQQRSEKAQVDRKWEGGGAAWCLSSQHADMRARAHTHIHTHRWQLQPLASLLISFFTNIIYHLKQPAQQVCVCTRAHARRVRPNFVWQERKRNNNKKSNTTEVLCIKTSCG